MVLTSEIKDDVGELTGDDAKAVIIEIADRFCDKPSNIALCKKLDYLKDKLVAKIVPNEKDSGANEVSVDVSIPEEEEKDEKELTADDLLGAASTDSEALGDLKLGDRARKCPSSPTKETCAKIETAKAPFVLPCPYRGKPMFCQPSGEVPIIKDNKPPMKCTKETIKACAVSIQVVCEPNVRPRFDYDTCCPTCKVEKPIVKPQPQCKIPVDCLAGKQPEMKDGCMTCKNSAEKCTKEQYKKCRDVRTTSGLSACLPGEPPTRTKDCCMSCAPIRSVCGQDADESGLDRPTKCNIKYKKLPECKTGVRPEFDHKTCCRSCRVLPTVPKKPEEKCTIDAFKACEEATEECSGDEKPEARSEFCCKSCKRPQRKCKVKDVLKQCGRIPECGEKDRPSPVAGTAAERTNERTR